MSLPSHCFLLYSVLYFLLYQTKLLGVSLFTCIYIRSTRRKPQNMATSVVTNSVEDSPNSSEEIDSRHGTPATKISPFSPRNTHSTQKPIGFGNFRNKGPPAFILTASQSNRQQDDQYAGIVPVNQFDPFIGTHLLTGTTQVMTDTSKLSPNACAFTPGTLVDDGHSNVMWPCKSDALSPYPKGTYQGKSLQTRQARQC